MVTTEIHAAKTVHGETLSKRMTHLKSELTPQLANVWDSALEAASAQMAIWAMKAGRLAITLCLGSVALLGALALFVYGFILLDKCLDYALAYPDMPWLSPLVRGGVYFGIPATAMLYAWHTGVGYGQVDREETEKKLAAKEATEKMEARRG